MPNCYKPVNNLLTKPINRFMMIVHKVINRFIMMSEINVGGRGKNAPYDTKLMRIPTPLEPQILQIKARYIEFLERGGNFQQPPDYLLDKKLVNKNNDDCNQSDLVNALDKLVNKINSKESGYKSNSAAQLIKDLMELYNFLQSDNNTED